MTEKIITFDDREQCRKKLPIFFGSNDNSLHAVRECVINARDILKDLPNSKIHVILYDDCRTVSIKDNGTGLPMIGETESVPNWKLLFLTLFSGTKMEDGSDDGGTYGCGNTIICYTSDYFQANVKKDGYEYQITFKNGGQITEEFHCLGKTNEQGTFIKFKLSDEVYTNTKFNPNDIELIVEKVCATLYNIEATFTYNDITKTFKYIDLNNYFSTYSTENYLSENIKINKKTFETINEKSTKKLEKTTPEIVFNFSNEPIQHSFLNGVYLIEKGSIHEGVIEGVKKQFHKFIKDEGLYEKKEKGISDQDIEQNISYAITVASSHVSFSNQTKFSTKKELYKEIVQKYISNFLETYFIENKKDALSIANKLLISKRANEKAENSRRNIRKKLEQGTNKSNERPEKFVPCMSKDKNKKELILIEGDSSLNSVKLSRDKEIHSIYPLKGKPLNALKKSLDDILNNNEIQDIFQILNCGMEYKGKPIKGIKKFNINDLNMSKIIAFCDEDEDGLHIRSLLICIFYVLAPEIIKQGHLYILDSPLYRIDTKNKTYLAYNEKEKNDIIRNLNNDKQKFVESRFKGLGGLSIDLLSETAMNVDNRKLTQVTINDYIKAKEMLEMFMDEDSSERKNFIEQYGEQYFDYSIYED